MPRHCALHHPSTQLRPRHRATLCQEADPETRYRQKCKKEHLHDYSAPPAFGGYRIFTRAGDIWRFLLSPFFVFFLEPQQFGYGPVEARPNVTGGVEAA